MQTEEPYFGSGDLPRMEEIDEAFRFLDSPEGSELCELLSMICENDGLPPVPEPTLQGDDVAGGGNGGSAVPITVTWMPFSGGDCRSCHVLRDVVHEGDNPKKEQNSSVHRKTSKMNMHANEGRLPLSLI